MTPDAMHTPDDFQLHLHFAVPGDRLFTALATEEGCKGWWTLFCEVGEQTGGRSSFYFPGDGFYAVMKILQREPAQRLEWMCVESKHNENTGYTDLHSWIDTRIRLLIKDLGNGSSQLDFTHFRLNRLECASSSCSGWTFFLNDSLRGYLEHGRGQPWSRDI